MRALATLALLAGGAAQASDGAACAPAPPPVGVLDFASRYVDGDPTRSVEDAARADAARAAVEPVDAFLSDLARAEPGAGACTLARMAVWARADALSDLRGTTAALTLGARLAGLALVAARAEGADPADRAAVAGWLARRVEEQMLFWEVEAPPGAARGNLRAWAALAAAAVSDLTDDPVMRGWAAWSVARVACTADADGAIPQEMTRSRRALHYQLHAVAPLATAAALLERQGIALRARCDGALERIVAFTLEEVATGAPRVAALAGARQSALDAGRIPDWQMAWLEPWLSLGPDPAAEAVAAPRRPLRYSKLGGDQTAIWGGE